MSCEIAAGSRRAHRNPNFSFAADLVSSSEAIAPAARGYAELTKEPPAGNYPAGGLRGMIPFTCLSL